MPDPSTLTILPWKPTVARLACYDMRGLTRNLEFADALVTCDRAVFFRSMLETMAQERGLIATFMPKPFAHLTGSGCHFHMSLWDGQRNLGAVLRVVRLQQPHPDAAGPGRPDPCRRAPRPCRGRRGARAEA
jgi:glutamine synthetase